MCPHTTMCPHTGVFIAVMSLLGFLGALWNSAAALGVNGGAQAMLALAVVVLGSICLADAKNSVLDLLALLVADQAAIIYIHNICMYVCMYLCIYIGENAGASVGANQAAICQRMPGL